MHRRRSRWLGVAGAVPCLVASVCAPRAVTVPEEEFELTGTIEVGTITSGANIDPDGYIVSADEAHSLPIGATGSVTFAGLAPRSYAVLLSGIASNCVVAGANPTPVVVLAGGNYTVQFDLNCS